MNTHHSVCWCWYGLYDILCAQNQKWTRPGYCIIGCVDTLSQWIFLYFVLMHKLQRMSCGCGDTIVAHKLKGVFVILSTLFQYWFDASLNYLSLSHSVNIISKTKKTCFGFGLSWSGMVHSQSLSLTLAQVYEGIIHLWSLRWWWWWWCNDAMMYISAFCSLVAFHMLQFLRIIILSSLCDKREQNHNHQQ